MSKLAEFEARISALEEKAGINQVKKAPAKKKAAKKKAK
jgi:BMFP domain-containing protein YqiC